MESRFSYKEWLSRYCLDLRLFENYSFKVIDVIPLRKVFILVTTEGNKILKKTEFGHDDLSFIKTSVDHLKKSGFNNIIDFVLNKEGNILTRWGEDNYLVMDLIEGRECDYNNLIDVKIAINSLSQLHRASKNIEFSPTSNRFRGFSLIESFKEKLEDLQKLKRRAIEYGYKGEFERVFLSNVDYFIEAMEKSIEAVKASKYIELCGDNSNYVLCHHDLAYHNILVVNEEGYFVDFDYSIIDLRVHDLCNFINKVTKFSCYDYEMLNTILKEYNKYNPLKKEEYGVLYGMLLFPESFYNISKDYFYKNKLWTLDTFVNKLEKKVQNIEEREEMLEMMKEEYIDGSISPP